MGGGWRGAGGGGGVVNKDLSHVRETKKSLCMLGYRSLAFS